LDHFQEMQRRVENRDLNKLIAPTIYTSDPGDEIGEKKYHDFSHIIKQDHAKRALEIAATGGHNIALYGPPGTGKTMLAKALCSILPPLTREQSIESTIIHSNAGVLRTPAITNPPFRAPHHTSSYVSVIGGGAYPKPGEVTLAHNGVLFLDEFPEFESRVLESLREPLEERVVRISRAKASVTFPASVLMVAALNPPSAVFRSAALVSASDERRFKKKLTGPIMDRVDMWVEVSNINHELLLVGTAGESSADIAMRVSKGRNIQYARNGNILNTELSPVNIQSTIAIQEEAENILNKAAARYKFSPRAYHKVLKLSRTIADLDASFTITCDHILEALQYRPKDIL
jgi:magnesium chelatase family protein